jgi:hypothetical protein
VLLQSDEDTTVDGLIVRKPPIVAPKRRAFTKLAHPRQQVLSLSEEEDLSLEDEHSENREVDSVDKLQNGVAFGNRKGVQIQIEIVAIVASTNMDSEGCTNRLGTFETRRMQRCGPDTVVIFWRSEVDVSIGGKLLFR